MFVRVKKRDDKQYLMIVESRRTGARIEQVTVASLGRLDKLQDSSSTVGGEGAAKLAKKANKNGGRFFRESKCSARN